MKDVQTVIFDCFCGVVFFLHFYVFVILELSHGIFYVEINMLYKQPPDIYIYIYIYIIFHYHTCSAEFMETVLEQCFVNEAFMHKH